MSAFSMERVNFLASHEHYSDHLWPVYQALPEELRGEFHRGEFPRDPKALTVVSSYGDYKLTEGPVIMFEHGAGFSYGDTNHPSYAGGPGRERVVLFCNVNEYAARRNAAAYPDIPQATVGSPKMDLLVTGEQPAHKYPAVAFSFHWNCLVAPETRWALPHYMPYFDGLQRGYNSRKTRRWNMYGHGHPLAWNQLSKVWEKSKIVPVRHFSDVTHLADVYVCDNSSTIYEFAALGKPVIVLNAPWYRRNVNHGIRFWENIPGEQVNDPKDLDAAISRALFEDKWAGKRQEITSIVYPHLGRAAQEAAGAIQQLLA